MQTSFLLRQPLALRAAMNIDRVPARLWIALQTAALWPTWRWLAARLADGSGSPPGLLALAALAALLWLARGQLRAAPRLPWLAAALAGTLAATALHGLPAPLIAHLLALIAWACCLLAFLPAERRGAMRVHGGVLWPAPHYAIAAAPVLGLAALAGLPFGSAAPMVWAGCFAACAAALLKGRSGRAFMLRLPLAGLAVLAASVLRGAALTALPADGLAHQAVGPLALAALCFMIFAVMSRAERRAST